MDAIDTIKILGSLLGNGGLSKGSGGNVLGNILGSALGGAKNQQTQGGDILGNVLGSLLGGASSGSGAGGLGDLLGSVLGGGAKPQQPQVTQSSGGLGDLLGSVLGGANHQSGGNSLGGDSGLGGLLGSALSKYAQANNPNVPDPRADDTTYLPQGLELAKANEQAKLVIRAMINAAKADGHIDQAEQEKILSKMGELNDAERAFLQHEFAAPLDVDSFINSIPKEMQTQIYAISLTAIDLDTNKEAQYLAQLAQGFGFTPQLANELHQHLGAPKIFNS